MRYPSGKSHLWAILAHPVAHVRAPEFMNPLIEREGRDAFLVPFHVLPEDLGALVPELVRIRNLKGFIVTIPHKPAMARLCHELGPNGRLTGTVNTVRIEEGGRLIGEMFDGLGLVLACRAHGIEPRGRSVVLLGAGGAGRAIAFALAEAGAVRLIIANRTPEKAESLAREVRDAFPGCSAAAGPADARGQEIVIQATSLGLKPDDPPPMDPATLSSEVQVARERGLRTVIGGRPMIEHQAKAQIEFLGPPAIPA
jgi:shikimate dehydrogenase